MAIKKSSLQLRLEVKTERDEKTGVFSSHADLFHNATGFGRTKEEAEENLKSSLYCMMEYEADKMIDILDREYLNREQKPDIDLIIA